MVNQDSSVTGWEGAPLLAPQAQTLLLQIYHQTIQEGDNTKEAQQYQKTSPLRCLYIWKSSKESMEDQMQTLKRINQESFRDQTQVHELNWPGGLYPTRDH